MSTFSTVYSSVMNFGSFSPANLHYLSLGAAVVEIASALLLIGSSDAGILLLRSSAEVLYGGRDGTFQYATLVSLSTKTQDGMDFSVKGKSDSGSFVPDAKVTYDNSNFKLVTSLAQASGSIGLALTGKSVVPGMNVILSGSLPDAANSGKVALEYLPTDVVAIKASSSLSTSPAVDVSVATNVDLNGRDLVVGGQGGYDAAKGMVSGWKVGFGYTHAKDYQIAASLNDKKDVCAQVAHSVNADLTVAAEIVRNLESAETSMTAGVARRLASGASQKVKVQHTGVVSVLHETTLDGNSKVAVSGQFDAKDLGKAPKYGLSLDFKY
jgi:hypothetical protein